jgi:hypothetical protein
MCSGRPRRWLSPSVDRLRLLFSRLAGSQGLRVYPSCIQYVSRLYPGAPGHLQRHQRIRRVPHVYPVCIHRASDACATRAPVIYTTCIHRVSMLYPWCILDAPMVSLAPSQVSRGVNNSRHLYPHRIRDVSNVYTVLVQQQRVSRRARNARHVSRLYRSGIRPLCIQRVSTLYPVCIHRVSMVYPRNAQGVVSAFPSVARRNQFAPVVSMVYPRCIHRVSSACPAQRVSMCARNARGAAHRASAVYPCCIHLASTRAAPNVCTRRTQGVPRPFSRPRPREPSA